LTDLEKYAILLPLIAEMLLFQSDKGGNNKNQPVAYEDTGPLNFGPWQERFMPPIVVSHIVMGQRKWKDQGGFPHVFHGGLSLLEVAVPFIELPPLLKRKGCRLC
jgi:hypothetical protein